MKKLMLIALLGVATVNSVPSSPKQVEAQQFLAHFYELAGTYQDGPAQGQIELAYDTLGADATTPRPELIKKWRRLAFQWHPDKAAPADKELYTRVFQVINNAHQILGLDKGV